jgi:hypothetical protein
VGFQSDNWIDTSDTFSDSLRLLNLAAIASSASNTLPETVHDKLLRRIKVECQLSNSDTIKWGTQIDFVQIEKVVTMTYWQFISQIDPLESEDD